MTFSDALVHAVSLPVHHDAPCTSPSDAMGIAVLVRHQSALGCHGMFLDTRSEVRQPWLSRSVTRDSGARMVLGWRFARLLE